MAMTSFPRQLWSFTREHYPYNQTGISRKPALLTLTAASQPQKHMAFYSRGRGKLVKPEAPFFFCLTFLFGYYRLGLAKTI